MSSRLFVGDIKTATKDDLDRAFNTFGEIKEIWMPRGDPGGFAFVEFFSSESAHSAMRALDNKAIGSDIVRVELSRKKLSSSAFRGGGGRRGGSFGGRGPPFSSRSRRFSRSPPSRRRRSRSPRRRRITRSRSRSPPPSRPRSPPYRRAGGDRDYHSSTSILGPPSRAGDRHDYGSTGSSLMGGRPPTGGTLLPSSSILGSTNLPPYGSSGSYSHHQGLGGGPFMGGNSSRSGDFDYSYSDYSSTASARGGHFAPAPPPPHQSSFGSASYDRNGGVYNGGRSFPTMSGNGGPPGRYDPYPSAYRGGPGAGSSTLLDGGRIPRSPPPYRGGGDRPPFEPINSKDDRRNGFDRSRGDHYGPSPSYGSGPSFRRSPPPPPMGRSRDFNSSRGRDMPPSGGGNRSYPPPRRSSPRRY